MLNGVKPQSPAEGGSRKGGSSHLSKMHHPVPKGGDVREALHQVNREVGGNRAIAAKPRRWMGVVDEAPKRPVAPAWNPGGTALPGPAARERAQVARGPHLAFRKDYHKVDPAEMVKRLGPGDEAGGVRPFRGVDGLRPEQQKMWEMKQPQKPGAWQDKYPKSYEQNGPAGPIPPGKMRVGPDRVGPVLEMKARRVDLRPHAKGHEEIDAHRVGVFPVWDPSQPPPNTADFAFDPDFLMKRMPADPEDRARAAAPALNARRSAAVDRLFGAIDPEKTGKIEVRKLLSHLQARRFKKRLDFWSRDGVLVSPDDLDEQLQGMLMSLLQRQSKDVRVQAAFLPSGGLQGCRAGRLGTLSGHVRLTELRDVYAALAVHIHDDVYFEQILEETWDVGGLVQEEGCGPVVNGRLESLDINANFR